MTAAEYGRRRAAGGGLHGMKAAALSLDGVRVNNLDYYREDLSLLLAEIKPGLAVLPAHTSLLLCASAGELTETRSFGGAFREFRPKAAQWNERFLALHGALAGELGIYLVAGTTLEIEGGRCYHTAYCFGPGGELCGRQRQTHLSREERELGLSRGVELDLIDLGGIKMGLVVATDARHPEVGRILALQGAGILAHTGALERSANTLAQQLAGMWAQVQQNECWGVEAQLSRVFCGRDFHARCAVLGPCVTAADLSGYLSHTGGGEQCAAARLKEEDRRRAGESFPALRMLNPAAYKGNLL
jgi:predicted amidohydrolase